MSLTSDLASSASSTLSAFNVYEVEVEVEVEAAAEEEEGRRLSPFA